MIEEKEQKLLELLKKAIADKENLATATEVIRSTTASDIRNLVDIISKNISLADFPVVMSILEEAFAKGTKGSDGVPMMLDWIHEEFIKSEKGCEFADIMCERFESAYYHGRGMQTKGM